MTSTTKKGVIWVSAFGALGLLVPAVLMLRYFAFGVMFGELEGRLWPTSILFMALEASGTTKWDVALVYAIALVSNVLLYAFVGALIWFAVQMLVSFGHLFTTTRKSG